MSECMGQKVERIILWPDGNIPYFWEGNCIPALDAYPVEGSKGAVVVCPGGGYVGKAAHEGAPIAKMLNEAGISAYVLDYRVLFMLRCRYVHHDCARLRKSKNIDL